MKRTHETILTIKDFFEMLKSAFGFIPELCSVAGIAFNIQGSIWLLTVVIAYRIFLVAMICGTVIYCSKSKKQVKKVSSKKRNR